MLGCEFLRDKRIGTDKKRENILIFQEKEEYFRTPQFYNLSRRRIIPECCEGKEATPTDVRLLERRSRRTGSLLPPMFSYTTRDSQKRSEKETLEDKWENNYDFLSIVQYR